MKTPQELKKDEEYKKQLRKNGFHGKLELAVEDAIRKRELSSEGGSVEVFDIGEVKSHYDIELYFHEYGWRCTIVLEKVDRQEHRNHIPYHLYHLTVTPNNPAKSQK